MKQTVKLAAALAMGLIAPQMASAAETLKLGIVAHKTGPLAGGEKVTQTPNVQLWVHEVNKAGGLTTILEKSLGAAAKGGATPLTDVLMYGETVSRAGLNFMDTPGYDPVSVTGQIAGGCQIVVFTTGRGSAFGSKPAPTIKLATNSRLFETMRDDMDVNCGDIVDAGVPVRDKGEEILETILRIASGEPSKSEALGLGDNEFVPWQVGCVM